MRKFKHWNAKELKFLRENVEGLDNNELATALGRTKGAIKCAISLFGMQRNPSTVANMMSRNTCHPFWKGGLPTRKDRQRFYRSNNREKIALKQAEYRSHYPERARAKETIGALIRSGELERLPCEVCGDTENVHGHHDNYDRPTEVRWLCVLHHVMMHPRFKRKEESNEKNLAHEVGK